MINSRRDLLCFFWATVCKTVCPMLSHPCLYVCPVLSCLSVLSVSLVYYGQTVGWIKMKLGMQLCLGTGHIVLDGDPAPHPPKGHSPHQFSAHICCGQMAGWIKMPLGMEIGLVPGDFVLDGDKAPHPQKGGRAPSPIFGPCPLWPNGWIDPDDTWYGGRPRPKRHCVTWGPSSHPLPRKKATAPNFRPMSIVAKRLYVSGYHLVWR